MRTFCSVLWARVRLIRRASLGGHVMYAARGMTAGRSRFMCVQCPTYMRRCDGFLIVPLGLGPLLCACCALGATRSAAASIGRTRTRRARAHDHYRQARLIASKCIFHHSHARGCDTHRAPSEKIVYGDKRSFARTRLLNTPI